MALVDSASRTPGAKLMFALLIAAVLTFPLFTVYLLVYDRQSQSEQARASIAQGWGGPQTLAGPFLVIPYQAQSTETVTIDNRPQTRSITVERQLFVAPTRIAIDTAIAPQRRARSIYEAVLYDAVISGNASYRLPEDLARLDVRPEQLEFARAELRFGVLDPRGLKPANQVTADGRRLVPQPGNGVRATNGSGFFAAVDASGLTAAPIETRFRFELRGHSHVAFEPNAGETIWTIRSPWPHPSFSGGFLPETRTIRADGFSATYRISNLALGRTLASIDDPQSNATGVAANMNVTLRESTGPAPGTQAQVGLVEPVDLYSQVNRSVKYGFLFIGFTFMAFLLFDVVAGVRVSAVEYLLVGAGLVLFFVMLLAFAEVVGFALAYVIAAAAIIALLTAYSAAVLKSRRRAGLIAGLLIALYAVLYVLLSLEAYSLLIGSILLFAALASVMYLTRNLEWGASRAEIAID